MGKKIFKLVIVMTICALGSFILKYFIYSKDYAYFLGIVIGTIASVSHNIIENS